MTKAKVRRMAEGHLEKRNGRGLGFACRYDAAYERYVKGYIDCYNDFDINEMFNLLKFFIKNEDLVALSNDDELKAYMDNCTKAKKFLETYHENCK